MKRVLEYDVKEDYVGKKLNVLLKSHFKMSSSLISDLKKTDDGILINGEHKTTAYILRSGDNVSLSIRELSENKIPPAPIEFKILYEDEDVMAVDKPPFVPTHPSVGNYENTLANGVIYYWRKKGEERVFRAVNRLDKNTSGVMLIAKNSYAHARLCDMLHTADFEREYIAAVEGEMDADGTVDAPIARAADSIIKRCVSADGQRAVTHYEVIKKYRSITLLKIWLETGRTHQIRVHMSCIGHPLVCDFLYGNEDGGVMKRQALHSSRITFEHPVSGEKIDVRCGIADDMKLFLDTLECR